MKDLYVSRHSSITKPKLVDRVDPVSYSEEWSGYERNGFCHAGKADVSGVQLNKVPGEGGSVILEPGGDTVRSAFDVHTIDGIVAVVDGLAELAREILGDQVYVFQSRINFKRSGCGTGWGWHSDFETWHTEDGMPKMRCLTAMVCLTENLTSNGPLMVLPGSHRKFLACPGETPDNHFSMSLKNQVVGVPEPLAIRQLAARGVEVITGSPGDVILFDCNLMHGSTVNMTPYDRTNLFVVFNAVSNMLVAPFCGKPPRPEFAAHRKRIYIPKEKVSCM